MSVLAAVTAPVERRLERLRRTKFGRAWARYGYVRGNVLAAGIAYFAFFSFFPVLAVAFTVTGLIVDGRLDLQGRVVDYVNSTFGGAEIISRTPGRGLVTIDRLVSNDVLTAVGAGGLVVLLFVGVGWIGALRGGISAVFGRPEGPNPVLAKLGDLALLLGIGLASLASMIGSVLVTTTTGAVLGWIGIDGGRGTGVLVNVITALVLLAIDTALFLLVLRLLCGVRLPVETLFTGALAGGVALGLLKLLGAVVVRYASGNRFLAASVIVAGLLVWMNLAARAGLLAASWAATTAEDRGALPPMPGMAPGAPGKGPAAGPGRPEAAASGPVPSYAERAADRTTLLAGAVLGVTAALGARVLGRAGGTLRDLVRRGDRDD